MSSYDSRYDDHRSSRRHDSFHRPQEYLSPTVGHDEKKPRRSSRGEYDSRRPDQRYYDRRRSPHSGPSSDDQRPRQPRPRHTWPPLPSVESERRSLAREAGGERLLREQLSKEIPERGTIDQDPLILEVAEHANQQERRFVVLSDSDTSGSKVFTPPTSEDESVRKARRRPSRIQTDFNGAPELQRRTASPYAMNKPTPSRTVSDAYLSPSIAPPRRQDSGETRKQRSPRASPRASPISRTGDNYFDSRRSDIAIDDSDDSRRPISRDGSVASLSGSEARRAPPSLAPAHRDTRRATDSSATMPAPRGLDTSSRPSPLVVASALAATAAAASKIGSAKDPATPRSASLNPPMLPREPSLGSRNASPVSMASQRSASPPSRSPRFSQEISDHMSSPDSRRASAMSSKAGSRNSSPPPFASVTMPRMPQMPSTDLDWNHLLAANASRRNANPSATKQPTRLSTSMRADSPVTARSASTSMASRPQGLPYPEALPYPMDNGPATPDVFMPAEQEHQWLPPSNDRPAPLVASERPPRPSRHSFANPPSEVRPAAPTRADTATRAPPTNAVGPTKQESEAMLAKGLPGCSRPEPTSAYDDWYTMHGAPSLDFCPNCIETIFERTVYRKLFRRSPPRDRSTRISCAFGSPWIRLAYLLTVQQRLADMQLFKDLADIDRTSDPCPKNREAKRSWYGLRDNEGRFVRDFQICYADVRKLERLLPTFSGFFQRLPDGVVHEAKRCSLRAETNRFQQYINLIFELHEKAHAKRTLPDPMPFVALVERKLSFRECERDALLLDSHWHYMSALPVFTVCEDCFDEVVEPEIKKGSDIAKRFNRAVQPAYGEGIGTSCQLYSPRMRKVFVRAIKDNDMKYLARKAKERREAEVRLQEKHTVIVRRLDRYEGRNSSDDEDSKRRLLRELRHLAKEWKEEWE